MAFLKFGQKKKDKKSAEKDQPAEPQLTYQVANLQGLGARARQEDSFTVANAFDAAMAREKGLLFAACDGMGGMRDG